MISAFGVDHGLISKIKGGSILGQAIRSDHGVGAGASGMAARTLAGGRQARRPATGASALAYTAPRATAKKEGHRAAQRFASMGSPKTYGGYEGAHPGVGAANHGWQSRAQSFEAVNKPAGAAPAGMRGPIQNRVKTKKMKAVEDLF